MNLERLSWKAGIASAILTVVALAFAVWTYVMPQAVAPMGSPLSANNVGAAAIVIQGSGNTVTTHPAEPPPEDHGSRRLIGTWSGVTRQSSPAGEIVSTGYSRLYEGGEYNFSGQLSTLLPNNGQISEVQATVLAAGTWRSNGNKLLITLSDVKTTASTLLNAAAPDTPAVPAPWIPKMEDMLPKGSTQEYTIVELTDTHLQARGTDIRGHPVRYEATRK